MLSYKILGEGVTESDEPPIFIFHGLLSNKKQWEGIGKIILNLTKRSVVAVDLRNHGDSPHVGSHRYEDHAADILNLFEKLGVEQASLVGHSMGGKAALGLALTAPLKITGVLVVDISPASITQYYKDEYPKILNAMKAVDFKLSRKVNQAKREAKNQLKDLKSDDYLLNTILSNIKIRPDATIGWAVNIDVLLKHINDIVSFPRTLRRKRYFGPTLFIGGQMSDYIPPDDLPGIRDMFPKAVISYIPKTGHNVHIDDPRSFLEIAIAFIRTHHYKRPHLDVSNFYQQRIEEQITVSTNMTVIAVDARNHGDSPDDNSHGYPDLAADISHLLAKYSVEKGILLGHGMGGRAAMALALTEDLTLTCPTSINSVLKSRNTKKYGMDILIKISKVRLLQHTGIKSLRLGGNQIRTKSTPVELSCRVHGPSPVPGSVPIVVLHDCLGCKKNWESVCQKITVSTNMTVIAVDARNHGDSPDDNSHGYPDLAADISHLLAKYSVEKGILLGHGMGGRAAMALALTEPAKVASLIVVDMSPVSTSTVLSDFYPKAIDILSSTDFEGADLNKAKLAAQNIIVENELHQSEPELQYMLTNVGKLKNKTYGWKYNLDALRKNVHNIVTFPKMDEKKYMGPTLFLGGKLSFAIPAEDFPGILKLFPNAHVLYVEGAGHNVHIDQPQTFYETVMQFLYYNALMHTAA
uniref:sn-1-specific diacylglycerol lipase ABHD11 n=1 Tax=Heliothis virescens TaxID=7102 RepID=A0A2A4K9W3_HELVI